MDVEDRSSQIAALQRRDPSAWRQAFDRHSREVYGFVFHLVGGDGSTAEDLHQETWLEVVDSIDACDPVKGSFRNWLFGVARRRVALHYRRRASAGTAFPIAEQDNALVDPMDHGVLPDEFLEQLEQKAVVRAALLALPADRRKAVLDKYEQGHSVKTIAARTGRSVKSVESLLTRTRQQLRGLLRGYFATSGEERSANLES